MRRRYSKVGAGLVAAALLLAGCGGSAEGGTDDGATEGGAATDSVSIGLIAAEQGPFAFAGISYLRGAELAIQHVNEEEAVPGVSIELATEEGSADPAKAITGLNRLIADDDVVGVICCISSGVAGAIKPVAISAEIPVNIYGAAALGLEEPPFIFRTAAIPAESTALATTRVIEAEGLSKVAHIAAADNDGQTAMMAASQEAATAAGAENVAQVETLFADTDFSGPVTQLLASSPDLIVVSLSGEQAATVIKSLREQGYTGAIVANNAVSAAAVLESFGASLADTYYAVEFTPASTLESAQAFTEAYVEEYGENPDLYSSQGYVAVRFLVEGIAAADESGDITRATLSDALVGISELDSIWGPVTFTEGQAAIGEFQIMQLDAEGQPALWTP